MWVHGGHVGEDNVPIQSHLTLFFNFHEAYPLCPHQCHYYYYFPLSDSASNPEGPVRSGSMRDHVRRRCLTDQIQIPEELGESSRAICRLVPGWRAVAQSPVRVPQSLGQSGARGCGLPCWRWSRDPRLMRTSTFAIHESDLSNRTHNSV